MEHQRKTLVPTAAALILTLASLATGQVTQHTLQVGGIGSLGCQGSSSPPTLDDGITIATAQLDFVYDAGTGVLQLDVANTSPTVPGSFDPLIRQVAFNVPAGAVSNATLLTQTATSGRPPQFSLSFDPELRVPPNRNAFSCFGDFNVLLTEQLYGIANPAAATVAPPAGTYSVGPARFTVQLSGPGIGLLTARTIALTFSTGPSSVNAALEFWCAGPSGHAAGFISNPVDECVANIWLSAPARIGTTVNLCFAATPGCHGCVLGSLVAGPVQVGPLTLPIGLPIALSIQVPGFSPAPLCFPLQIPNQPSLVGQSVYLTVATTAPGSVTFSPAFNLQFQQ